MSFSHFKVPSLKTDVKVALDQVKLHIDSTFATLVQEMKELRQALDKERETTKRLSILAAPSVAGDQASLSPSTSPLQPPASAISLPAPTPLVVGPSEDHLKQIQEQHEELENLRRELAITRQSHAEHISESSATISSLKDEIAQIKKGHVDESQFKSWSRRPKQSRTRYPMYGNYQSCRRYHRYH